MSSNSEEKTIGDETAVVIVGAGGIGISIGRLQVFGKTVLQMATLKLRYLREILPT